MYAEPCDLLHSSSSRERHLALEKQPSGSNRLYTAAHAVTPTSMRVFSVRQNLSPAVYRQIKCKLGFIQELLTVNGLV